VLDRVHGLRLGCEAGQGKLAGEQALHMLGSLRIAGKYEHLFHHALRRVAEEAGWGLWLCLRLCGMPAGRNMIIQRQRYFNGRWLLAWFGARAFCA